MSASLQEQSLGSMSPGNKKRPLSIIEENDDDGADSVGSEQAEKENDEQEVQKRSNGPKTIPEDREQDACQSPSFKALKQFFINKTESHNTKNKNGGPEEKGSAPAKPKRVQATRKTSTDASHSPHRKLSKTKSPEFSTTTTAPTSHHSTSAKDQNTSAQHHHNTSTTHHHQSTQQHHSTSSKPPIFSKATHRIAPKPQTIPKIIHTTSHTTHTTTTSATITTTATSTTTTHSKKPDLNTRPCPSPTPTSTKSTTRPRSSLMAPTAATQARENAVKKSSSFGAIDRLRSKTSSPTPTKVKKSNSVGKTTTKKTVAKRNSTGSKDVETKQSSKPQGLDRSFSDSPMSMVSEADSLDSIATDVSAISTDYNNKVSDSNGSGELVTNSSISNQSYPETKPHLHELEAVSTIGIPITTISETIQSAIPSKPVDSVSSSLSLSANQKPKCESETSSSSSSPPSNLSIQIPSAEPRPPITITKTPSTPESHVTKPIFTPTSPTTPYLNTNDSIEEVDEQDNEQDFTDSNNNKGHDDRIKHPLSLSISSSSNSPTSIIPPSPSSLSPSQQRFPPRSPKLLPKFRTSPTLSRRISVERNNSNNKTTSLNGKLTPSISNNNTFPRSFSREHSLTDLVSMEDGKDYGYILDKSRIAAANRATLPGSPLLANIYRSARRGSYFFKRKQSNESLSSLSENEMLESTYDEITPISAADLNKLKETADRLHLTTRRGSILTWRQTYMDDAGLARMPPDLNGGDATDENLTFERKQKINNALDWLKNELQDMRTQDQALARQLLTIRQDIHQLKLQRCTEEHQDLLDDFKSELEEREEFSDVLDIPHPIFEDNPLKHIGITRHNMSARRFSAC